MDTTKTREQNPELTETPKKEWVKPQLKKLLIANDNGRNFDGAGSES